MLTIIGIGPGKREGMTIEAYRALENSDCIVGYTVYVELVRNFFPDKQYYTTPMTQETERCRWAISQAEAGRKIALVCSGDSGVYGLAGLVCELAGEGVELEILPGVTAACSGAAVLGAPLTHDFAIVSLSDRLTPWGVIERRLRAAALGDFVICLYNPASKGRPDYLRRACDILLEEGIEEDRVCGVVHNIGREGQDSRILPLADLRDYPADMFTTVYIGNAMTREYGGRLVTPRGYSGGRPLSIIFAGTSEGRKLYELCTEHEIPAIFCVATEYGKELLGQSEEVFASQGASRQVQIHMGRMDREEMADLFRKERPVRIIDATHPYAVEVTGNIRDAAEAYRRERGLAQNVYYRVLRRLTEEAQPERASAQEEQGKITYHDTMAQAVSYLQSTKGNILAATGSKQAAELCQLKDFADRVYLRILPNAEMREQCLKLGFAPDHILCMRGPFSRESNERTLRAYHIRYLLTKQSGRAGGYPAKAEAARVCGAELVVLTPPQETEGVSLTQVCEMLLESSKGDQNG